MAKLDPSLIRLLDDVKLEVPGTFEPVIVRQVFNTVEAFCLGSNVWQCCLGIDTEPGQHCYDIYSPTVGGVPRRIMGAAYDREDGAPFTGRVLMPTPRTIQFSFVPATREHIKVWVALSPADFTEKNPFPMVPDWFWLEYFEPLKAGVMARLQAQPAKPYSNPQLASYNAKLFQKGMLEARVQKTHGRVFAGQAWHFPQTFRGRRA